MHACMKEPSKGRRDGEKFIKITFFHWKFMRIIRFWWKIIEIMDLQPRKNCYKRWNHAQSTRGAICNRTVRSRASGVPCGSIYASLSFWHQFFFVFSCLTYVFGTAVACNFKSAQFATIISNRHALGRLVARLMSDRIFQERNIQDSENQKLGLETWIVNRETRNWGLKTWIANRKTRHWLAGWLAFTHRTVCTPLYILPLLCKLNSAGC